MLNNLWNLLAPILTPFLAVISGLLFISFSWQKHKTKKAEKKLEDTEEQLATEKVKAEVKELETEIIKEAVKHEKEIDQKEVENEQAIQETQDDSETLDAINTMLDKFNRRV
jgi:H+/gluconate symporter-like permease